MNIVQLVNMDINFTVLQVRPTTTEHKKPVYSIRKSNNNMILQGSLKPPLNVVLWNKVYEVIHLKVDVYRTRDHDMGFREETQGVGNQGDNHQVKDPAHEIVTIFRKMVEVIHSLPNK